MSNTDLNIVLKIIELKQEAQDYFSTRFERPRNFNYEPGNWMDIRFPIREFPVGKTYSFASSPTENDLLIGFKKGVSKFKKALEQIKPGDKMLITQYGSNGFLLNKKYKSLFIAGGIGITPFRSMIKEAFDNKEYLDISLIFVNHNDNFPFQNELGFWQEVQPLLKVSYIITKKEGRLTKQKLLKLIPDITDRIIYIAGPTAMVYGVVNILLSMNIKRSDIQIDDFEGY